MAGLTESVAEEAALAWLESVGWRIAHGPEIAPDVPAAERRDYVEVVQSQRLRDAPMRPRAMYWSWGFDQPKPKVTISHGQQLARLCSVAEGFQ